MSKSQSVKKWLYTAALTVTLAVSLLSVGITYGRYSTEDKSDLRFRALETGMLQMHGITEKEKQKKDEWSDVPQTWEADSDGAYVMNFCVTNGDGSTEGSYCEYDVNFCIRVSVTDGFSRENTVISLTVVDDTKEQNETTYVGVAQEVTNPSALYDNMGAGCVYTFYDDKGMEMKTSLRGGELSVREMTLKVSGDADVSLVNMYLVPEIGD